MNFEIENLPLYWRFGKNLKKIQGIPELYKFNFNFDKKLGLIIGNKDPEFKKILNKIYKQNANIGYMIDGHNLALSYGEEFFRYLLKVSGKNFKKKLFLDFGCGGCITLLKLKNLGAKTLGVDPSPIALKYSKKYNIDLINSYLNKNNSNINADIIFSMDVMEHVLNPVEILEQKALALKENGRIIINVPNCEYSIKQGDISMAIHQHVNMFDRHSLQRTIEMSGLEVERLDFSKFGSSIYCVAKKRKFKKRIKLEVNKKLYDNFFYKIPLRVKNFRDKIFPVLDKKTGFFIFQRSLPYLSSCNYGFNFQLYDNNILWHNKYLDGLKSKVLNQYDCARTPPNNLVVISDSFSKVIKSFFRKKVKSLNVITEKEIFKNE